MKILSHASAKKKTKRLKGFEFRTFISFSSDILAEKRLTERKIGAKHMLFSSVNESCHTHGDTFTVGWSVRSTCVSYSSYSFIEERGVVNTYNDCYRQHEGFYGWLLDKFSMCVIYFILF